MLKKILLKLASFYLSNKKTHKHISQTPTNSNEGNHKSTETSDILESNKDSIISVNQKAVPHSMKKKSSTNPKKRKNMQNDNDHLNLCLFVTVPDHMFKPK